MTVAGIYFMIKRQER